MASIRTEYEKFKEVVDAIFEREDWEGGASALRDITATYEPLLTIDALDLSSMGCMAWVASKEAYEGRRDKVRITAAAAAAAVVVVVVQPFTVQFQFQFQPSSKVLS